MEKYFLSNGEQLYMYEACDFGEIGEVNSNIYACANFSLISQVNGETAGILIVKNGQKMKNTYVGELNVAVFPSYKGLSIEKILLGKLSHWISNMENVRKAKFSVWVSDLLVLEFLLDISQKM